MKLVKKRVLREIQLPCWPAEFRFRVNDVLIGEISTSKSAHLRIKHNFVVVKRWESTVVERHYLTMHRPWTWMCSVWDCLIGDISASSQGPPHSHFCQLTVTTTLCMSVMFLQTFWRMVTVKLGDQFTWRQSSTLRSKVLLWGWNFWKNLMVIKTVLYPGCVS